jgi:hypothetical protein
MGNREAFRIVVNRDVNDDAAGLRLESDQVRIVGAEKQPVSENGETPVGRNRAIGVVGRQRTAVAPDPCAGSGIQRRSLVSRLRDKHHVIHDQPPDLNIRTAELKGNVCPAGRPSS